MKFKNVDELLNAEVKGGFDFFKEYSNLDKSSRGYGLVVDRSNNLKRCSIASVGYMFSILVVGCNRGYIEVEVAKEHAKRTMITLRDNVDNYKGFFAHFVDMESGHKLYDCEFSTIDTALCVEGILTAMSFFNDQEINQIAKTIIMRVDYEDMVFDYKDGRKLLHMSYNPVKGGSYTENSDENGYIWHWGGFAEQMMMYIHMAFNDDINLELAKELYDNFTRPTSIQDGKEFVYTDGGAFFIYEFMNGWFDYQKYDDRHGFNIFENAQLALKAHIEFCASGQVEGLSETNWGPNAGDTPDGYRVYGAAPFADHMLTDMKEHFNGTTQQYTILAALPLDPQTVKDTIWNLYQTYPQSFKEYGFTDGMNLNLTPPWFCDNYIGIDKGISTIMIDNYYNQTVWNNYMKNELVQKAIERLEYKQK